MRALRLSLFAALGIFVMVAAALAAGPDWKSSCGWDMSSDYNRMYDPKTVVKFSGEVAKVDKVPSRKGMGEGVHILIKADDPCSMAPVHLGPAWYIENQDTKIKEGDKVTVTGSKVKMDGETIIIAKSLDKGDKTLMLRDDAGTPYWSGWRKKGK